MHLVYRCRYWVSEVSPPARHPLSSMTEISGRYFSGLLAQILADSRGTAYPQGDSIAGASWYTARGSPASELQGRSPGYTQMEGRIRQGMKSVSTYQSTHIDLPVHTVTVLKYHVM